MYLYICSDYGGEPKTHWSTNEGVTFVDQPVSESENVA